MLQSSRSDPMLLTRQKSGKNSDLIDEVGGGQPIGTGSKNINFEIQSKRPSVAPTNKKMEAPPSAIPDLSGIQGLNLQNSSQKNLREQENQSMAGVTSFMPPPKQSRLSLAIQELQSMMRQDQSLLQKRLVFIRTQLDTEVQPMRVVSRDHTRTNRNGVKLDFLEQVGARPNYDGTAE